MAKKLDPLLIEVMKKYDIDLREALWDCHGTWVMYHKYVEQIAARAGIEFESPKIVEANSKERTAVIFVRGMMGDKDEWSFGEATPANNKNSYPFAMAEKRAKDRVALKLVGLHGLVYSEEEADDFKAPPPPPPQPEFEPSIAKEDMPVRINKATGQQSLASMKDGLAKISLRLADIFNLGELANYKRAVIAEMNRQGWPRVEDVEDEDANYRAVALRMLETREREIQNRMMPNLLMAGQ
jgi:hypothetical protein